MSTLPRLVCLFAIWLLAASNANAFCLPMVHYVNVGAATGTGTGCNYVYADLQTAINNVACSNTVLSIAGGVTLGNVALEINGKTNLTIVGLGAGTTCNSPPPACDPEVGCGGGGGGAPPAPNVTLQGTGAGSVFYIHGNSSVTLESLTLKDGGGTDFGGGIHFTGAGALTILNSTITQNSANSQGGGIQFNGSGGNATLTLGAGTIIDVNDSGGDGGGIHINGSARLFALKPYTLIANNHADNGHGGGIYAAGPAMVDIGSPGYNGAPVIEYNSAAYGGGVSMDAAPDDANVTVRIFSVDANNPVQVSNNTASHTGGGFWMHPYLSGVSNTDVFPLLCALDFRIDNNIAQEGTAVYADTDSSVGNGAQGGLVYVNSNSGNLCSTPESPPSLGSVPCTPGVACNTMNGNVAEDNANNPKPGSVILIQDHGSLLADRLVMRGNHGAHAVRAFDSQLYVQNCLLADNTFSAERFRMENDGNFAGLMSLDGCTLKGNSIGASSVIYSPYPLTLSNSIIDEPGVETLSYTGNPADLAVSYILSNDVSTLPFSAGIVQGAPDYVDAAGANYHLKATSIGVDFAPATGGYDLDRVPRDVDLPEVPNSYGPRDIGAYELQYVCSPDTIYCNGFDTYQ